jgi:hypothetical protein
VKTAGSGAAGAPEHNASGVMAPKIESPSHRRQKYLFDPYLAVSASQIEASAAYSTRLTRPWCPPSALVGQIRQIEEGSVSGSS